MGQQAALLQWKRVLLPDGAASRIVGATVCDILARHANEKS